MKNTRKFTVTINKNVNDWQVFSKDPTVKCISHVFDKMMRRCSMNNGAQRISNKPAWIKL